MGSDTLPPGIWSDRECFQLGGPATRCQIAADSGRSHADDVTPTFRDDHDRVVPWLPEAYAEWVHVDALTQQLEEAGDSGQIIGTRDAECDVTRHATIIGGVRIVVYPHRLTIGGSQISAIDLAGGLAARGHEVSMFARPGDLAELVPGSGVRLYLDNHGHPARISFHSIRQLRRLARSHDVIHAFEPRPCTEAFYATLGTKCRYVASVMGIRVPWYLPTTAPLTVGIDACYEFTRRWWPGQVQLVHPPIDVDAETADGPGIDVAAYGLDAKRPVAVIVSRLAPHFKLDGVMLAIDAVALGAEASGLQLLVVGGGTAIGTVARHADRANDRAGRRVVTLAGPMLDPRPAYRVADIVLGTGLSLLRGLLHLKPGIVLGRKGYFARVTPENFAELKARGFYGVGPGGDFTSALADLLATMAGNREAERLLAAQNSAMVAAQYGLDDAVGRFETIYRSAIAAPRDAGLRQSTLVPLRRISYEAWQTWYEMRARRLGLAGDERSNFVFGSLRNRALPRRERRSPTNGATQPGVGAQVPDRG